MKKITLPTLFCMLVTTLSIPAYAASKTIALKPLDDGRASSASSATFQVILPEDLAEVQKVVVYAIGNQRGKHEILIDTHVSAEDTKGKVALESLAFTTRKSNQTLRLDISDATMHEASWVPGQTKLSFRIQASPESIERITGIRVRYNTTPSEYIDPLLEEALIVGPVTTMAPRQLDGLLPVDLDEFSAAFVPLSATQQTKAKNAAPLNSGRPAGAKPNKISINENSRFKVKSASNANTSTNSISDQDADQPLATK